MTFRFAKSSRVGGNLLTTSGPGVGLYDPKDISKHSPTWKIGTSIRDINNSDVYPGPSDYNPKYLGKKTPGYSLSKSTKVLKVEKSPGPGDYNYYPKLKGGITIKRRYYLKDKDNFPGPQDYKYESNKVLKKSPAYS